MALAIGIAMAPLRARAESGGMDPLLEATLQLKVQSYDRKIARRVSAKRFVVVILSKSGGTASETAAREMRDAFGRVAEKYRVGGIKPTIVSLNYDAKLAETLASQGASMVYVTRGLEGELSDILKAAAAVQAPTVTRVREHVAAGVTIGIVVDRGKPRIVINLKAMQGVGMELDAEMLSLAEVVR